MPLIRLWYGWGLVLLVSGGGVEGNFRKTICKKCIEQRCLFRNIVEVKYHYFKYYKLVFMRITETIEKKNVHLGRNVQRTREILGMKQLTLADITGMSQQNISKLEQSEFIPDDTLEKLANGLGVSVEFVKNFNEEKAILNIQNYNTFNDSSVNSSQHYQPTITHNNEPVDKIVELFEKLLKSEQEKVELLANANKAILELSEQLKGMRK